MQEVCSRHLGTTLFYEKIRWRTYQEEHIFSLQLCHSPSLHQPNQVRHPGTVGSTFVVANFTMSDTSRTSCIHNYLSQSNVASLRPNSDQPLICARSQWLSRTTTMMVHSASVQLLAPRKHPMSILAQPLLQTGMGFESLFQRTTLLVARLPTTYYWRSAPTYPIYLPTHMNGNDRLALPSVSTEPGIYKTCPNNAHRHTMPL